MPTVKNQAKRGCHNVQQTQTDTFYKNVYKNFILIASLCQFLNILHFAIWWLTVVHEFVQS